jgi:hypothetical protein
MSKKEKRIQKLKKVKKKMTNLFSAFLAAVTALSVVKEKVPLDRRPHIVCQVQDKKFSALVDTGATVSVMSKKMFESLPGHEYFEEVPMLEGFSVQGVGDHGMQCSGRYAVPFEMLGINVVQPIYILDHLQNHSWILGIDIIRALHLVVTADTVELRTVLPAINPGYHPVFALKDFTIPSRSVIRKKLYMQDLAETPARGATVVVAPNYHVPHVWEGIQEVGHDGSVWCVISNIHEEDI